MSHARRVAGRLVVPSTLKAGVVLNTEPTRKARWCRRIPVRPSVRAFMAVVLLLGGALGWVVYKAGVPREAVAAIERSGGEVFYDWDLSPRRVPGLAPVGELSGLGTLCLSQTKVTDAGLGQLARLNGLRTLRVSGTGVTAEGAAGLRKMLPGLGAVVY